MKERDFYSPNQIRFSRAQLLWMMQNISILRSVEWPPDCKVTGYTGSKSGHNSRAPYENPAAVTAELLTRIEKCGPDGLIMELVYSDPDNYTSLIQHIANAMHLEPRTIERRINAALRYISGKCPKWRDCPGAGKCGQCANCPRSKDREGELRCTKLPRFGRSYDDFKRHKRSHAIINKAGG